MQIITKDELFLKKEYYKHLILDRRLLFIHPTDTIYGLGCNAEDPFAVDQVRQLKEHMHLPFSVIAPSKFWILRHCELNALERGWLEKLPGPYTLILRLKTTTAVAPDVNLGLPTLGVRIPDHWFREFVEYVGVPIVTTSANRAGDNYMRTLDDLHPSFKRSVSFIIYDGELQGRPSLLVKAMEEQEQVLER
ncbi:MAG: Sua5/YciO/YrdC/YwlC family protein [Candidatus Woesearchaeota archaeon]